MRHFPSRAALLAALVVVGGCVAEPEVTTGKASGQGATEYLGIQTVLLEGDMVSFRIAMKGARNGSDVEAYGRCAAAQYALIRGAGFARHVRTQVAKAGQVWRGDAVYLISAALPQGLHTIDAEVTVRDCGELGIPTV